MIQLSEREHKALLKSGRALFDQITKERSSLHHIPSHLHQKTTSPYVTPSIAKEKREIHRLTQLNNSLQDHIQSLETSFLPSSTISSTSSTSQNHVLTSPQRKQLRSLDTEGALRQENEALRRQLHSRTASEKNMSLKITELQQTNKHLTDKIALFRIELQRKDTAESGVAAARRIMTKTSLSQQDEITKSENIRLRTLLAERNELTIHLRSDLELISKDRVLLLRNIAELKRRLRDLLNRGTFAGGETAVVEEGRGVGGENGNENYEDEEFLSRETGRENIEDETPRDQDNRGFFDIWTEVLWSS